MPINQKIGNITELVKRADTTKIEVENMDRNNE